MNARAKQADAVQGADEESQEDVQTSTSTAPRSQQRGNVTANTAGVTSSASEQSGVVRESVNTYEIAVLYHPDLEIDLEKATSKVEKIITEGKGKITKTDNWGKRKLAYPIKKQEYAVYVFYTVNMPPESVLKVEQTFNITDEIIRFLITRPDFKAQAKAEALKEEKAKKAAERGDSADDEESEDATALDETEKLYNQITN
jgi:small subunit ribosomal protein S6